MITNPTGYNDSALMLRYLVLRGLALDGCGSFAPDPTEMLIRNLLSEVRDEIVRRIKTGEHHSP